MRLDWRQGKGLTSLPRLSERVKILHALSDLVELFIEQFPESLQNVLVDLLLQGWVTLVGWLVHEFVTRVAKCTELATSRVNVGHKVFEIDLAIRVAIDLCELKRELFAHLLRDIVRLCAIRWVLFKVKRTNEFCVNLTIYYMRL